MITTALIQNNDGPEAASKQVRIHGPTSWGIGIVRFRQQT